MKKKINLVMQYLVNIDMFIHDIHNIFLKGFLSPGSKTI